MKQDHQWIRVIFFCIVALTLLTWWQIGFLNPAGFVRGCQRLVIFFSELFPPNLKVLPTLTKAIIETIQISLGGTVLGFLLSLPLAFLGTRTLFPHWIAVIARIFIGAARTVPSILFGVIFVIACGLGPLAGTLGVAFYTMGYLAKLYYETFEGVDKEVIEAVRSTGCNRLQLMRFAIWPESINTIVSQLLFMFEYNIRSSTIMGFVGAGGIGYYMLGYVQMLQYQHLATALLLTFVVVIIIDHLSFKLRSLILTSPTKPIQN